jgi:hypothetical protein
VGKTKRKSSKCNSSAASCDINEMYKKIEWSASAAAFWGHTHRKLAFKPNWQHVLKQKPYGTSFGRGIAQLGGTPPELKRRAANTAPPYGPAALAHARPGHRRLP